MLYVLVFATIFFHLFSFQIEHLFPVFSVSNESLIVIQWIFEARSSVSLMYIMNSTGSLMMR